MGAAILLISGLAIWVITKRITKPISELTVLSRKMSDLDFDAKYESRAGNEIDELVKTSTECPRSWRRRFLN